MNKKNFMDPLFDTSDMIYHYTSVDTLIKYILPQNSLRFSHLSSTNDPEESKYHIMDYIDDVSIGPDYFMDNLNKMRDISKGITLNIRLICFSQDDADFYIGNGLYSNKGYARPRMWAQYANNHQGVCLVFNKAKIIDIFKNSFSDKQTFYGNVSYEPLVKLLNEEENINAQSGFASDLLNKSVEEIVNERIIKYHKIYFFSKHKDWKTENEFRLVLRETSGNEVYLNIDGCLEYIILGHKFDDNLIKPIKILIDSMSYKPNILKFVYNRNGYCFVPIDL